MYGGRPTNIQGELQVAAIEGQVKAPILGSILARVGLFLAQQLLRAKYGFFASEKTSGVVRNGGGGRRDSGTAVIVWLGIHSARRHGCKPLCDFFQISSDVFGFSR